MRPEEVVRLFSSREVVQEAFLSALPRFFSEITVKEVQADLFIARITEGVDFLAIYPSLDHGDWFLVRSAGLSFTISTYAYKKAVMYNKETKTISIISVIPPKRIIKVPPL